MHRTHLEKRSSSLTLMLKYLMTSSTLERKKTNAVRFAEQRRSKIANLIVRFVSVEFVAVSGIQHPFLELEDVVDTLGEDDAILGPGQLSDPLDALERLDGDRVETLNSQLLA